MWKIVLQALSVLKCYSLLKIKNHILEGIYCGASAIHANIIFKYK